MSRDTVFDSPSKRPKEVTADNAHRHLKHTVLNDILGEHTHGEDHNPNHPGNLAVKAAEKQRDALRLAQFNNDFEAEYLRHAGKGSHDPIYENSKKNK